MITIILSHLLWLLKSLTQPLVALNRWAHKEYNKLCVEMSNSKGNLGVHTGTISCRLMEDFPNPGMLCTLVGPGKVKVAQGMDYPVGVAVSAGKANDLVAVRLLGCSLSTMIVNTCDPIKCGEPVYVGHDGGVRSAPKEWPGIRIGIALGNSAADSFVEVDLYPPMMEQAPKITPATKFEGGLDYTLNPI